MKFSRYLLLSMAAFAFAAVSCTKQSDSSDTVAEQEGPGVLKISLQGQSGFQGRALPSATPNESAIHRFTVYVFNNENNKLEASVTASSGTTATVSGLSSGFTKKVVVVANAPTTFPSLVEGDDISKLTSGGINLTYQSPANVATNGLVMVGESAQPVVMNPAGTTTVDITMKRLVAKVRLGTITVMPEAHYDPDLFEVTGVSIQRAIAVSTIYGEPVNATNMYGGYLGSYNNPVQTYLYDDLSQKFSSGAPAKFDNFFYVFPFQDADNCTLLTIRSSYSTDPVQYFPIRINAFNGDDDTDGTYLQSNHSYVLNVTVNNLGEGTTDPDMPPAEVSLKVDLDIAPWELDIVQKVIW